MSHEQSDEIALIDTFVSTPSHQDLDMRMGLWPYTADKHKKLLSNRPTAIFHRFCDLPSELRIHIWQLCFPAPQKIQLRLATRDVGANEQISLITVNQHGWGYYDLSLEFDTQFPRFRWLQLDRLTLPPLLFVCHEARQVFLDVYTQLGIPTALHGTYRPRQKILYFNYSRDSLLLTINHVDELLEAFVNNFRGFPNFPMNIKRISSWGNAIRFEGEPPMFPHNQQEQRKQQVLTQSARLALSITEYRHGNWNRHLSQRFEGWRIKIGTDDELFMDVV
ncbi:hypothetical protein BJ875DRAFT_456526 [Amylocarpus encephaloides]|uniref:2EXR domain-containing protein n=1 Tax=Amylocarpus encephaloides TaxID=45428 RepID=A0A9P7YMA7_9HELO|nr:hypothetical protein BJ875DRAFT_456526 [Amylocarpus encephaloides]